VAGLILEPLRSLLSGSHARAFGESSGRGRRPGPGGLEVVDLGAGTGANLRWLAPRLPDPDRQHWTLVDHDPGLLARGPVQATAVRADVTDLARVLAELGGADLVTAAALLDLLDPAQVTAIIEAVTQAGIPALFSLSVTGAVSLDPPDPHDRRLAEAFDEHQRRDGRLGPDAGPFAARLLRERGWSVLEIPTPWVLNSARDGELIDAWLEGRVEAAGQQQAELAPAAADWLTRRRARPDVAMPGAGRSGLQPRLEITVGHLDLLTRPN